MPKTLKICVFSRFFACHTKVWLHSKSQKPIKLFCVLGACSFSGADFCPDHEKAAGNTFRIDKGFEKAWA